METKQIIKELFQKNRGWARSMIERDPDFFKRLSEQQAPQFLWIGCSDSRVPANEIVAMAPGELFVHRNVANVVVHTDINCLSVIQYAVDVLKVRHVIICGHYGCGGVVAAIRRLKLGLIDNWLRHVQDIQQKHAELLAPVTDESDLIARMCELNVIEQIVNLSQTTIISDAWERGQKVAIHGWLYSIVDGLVRDLGLSAENPEEVRTVYQEALQRITRQIAEGQA